MPYWVNCGNYVLTEEAIARFPDRGDHESSTFPELAAAGELRAYRHEGLWLTVNTPKELRVAQEHVESHPEWLARERIARQWTHRTSRRSIAGGSTFGVSTSRGGTS